MANWLYPANTKYYDVLRAFGSKQTYWPIKSKIVPGDNIYIYLAAPYKQIGFVGSVIQTSLPEAVVTREIKPFFKQTPPKSKEKRSFMEIGKITPIPLIEASPFSLSKLREHGLNGMLMGPRNLENSPILLEYVKGCRNELRQNRA